jgi:hypothetical protein
LVAQVSLVGIGYADTFVSFSGGACQFNGSGAYLNEGATAYVPNDNTAMTEIICPISLGPTAVGSRSVTGVALGYESLLVDKIGLYPTCSVGQTLADGLTRYWSAPKAPCSTPGGCLTAQMGFQGIGYLWWGVGDLLSSLTTQRVDSNYDITCDVLNFFSVRAYYATYSP